MLLSVDLGKKSYDILIEERTILNAGKWINLKRRVPVLTDDSIPEE